MTILYEFFGGIGAEAPEVNSNIGFILQNTAINALNLRAIGHDGTDGVTEHNFKYDLFTSDSISTNYGWSYNASTNLYEVPDLSGFYVVIEATSLTTSNFAINNCVCLPIASGKWVLYCTTGSAAVQRAQVYKTLFYGSNGSDPKVTGITGLTALKTSTARDVGKRGIYISYSASAASNVVYTFDNTSTNTDVSSWSYLDGGSGTSWFTWQIPSASTINESLFGAVSDETGTDREADERDNPTNCRLINSVGSTASVGRIIVISTGGITEDSTGGTPTRSVTDFNADHGVPDFTAASISDVETSTLITSSTTITTSETAAFVYAQKTVDSANTLVTSVSFDGGSNYTVMEDLKINDISQTGTSFIVKFELTRTDLSAQASISAFGAYYG